MVINAFNLKKMERYCARLDLVAIVSVRTRCLRPMITDSTKYAIRTAGSGLKASAAALTANLRCDELCCRTSWSGGARPRR